ncbi:histidine kinase [Winogradskyella echinorum]|uniref:Histidine kinase n=1 Tax=Winogradskyella echinorum TaxID=538189 RepID=A0ABR6Y390_9FLAO|nr:histidine kinase [Winogradskyella echinorum]MBC3847202.1 histidine kinase [Winogradskyella echinorum]MBC5751550.1 histidine kinase [Winogradskyella echinorum]
MTKSIKNIIITFFIGCIVFVLGSLFSSGFNFESVNEFLIYFSIYQLYTFVLSYVNTLVFNFLEKRKFGNYEIVKRIAFGVLGSTVVTLITIFILRVFVEVVIFGESFDHFVTHQSWSGYSFGLWVTLTIVTVFYVIYFYNRYQKNKIKEQKVIAGAASAKFDALKNQLDPHFLFNSLNVLTSLIEENPDAAQKFTTSLSKVYRYVLEQKNKELVTVDEELKFARTYMSLLKTRFEDSIIFEIPDKASNPESRVVPLSLQLLLENAVKHNMVTSSKPLHIKIYEDKGHLVVMNNLQPKQIVKKSSGVGLENIKQRYSLLSDRKVIINQRAKDFAVAIPMLTKQVSIMRTTRKSQESLNDDYVRARKRVEELKAFYYSLISYVFVIPFLVFIWYQYSSNTIQWFWFPTFGWGLSLVIQAYRVFVDDGAFGAGWEKRKIEEYMKRDDEKKRWN